MLCCTLTAGMDSMILKCVTCIAQCKIIFVARENLVHHFFAIVTVGVMRRALYV